MNRPMHPPRLLIVEDENIVAADLALSLTHLDYTVVGTTGSGEEALVLAAQVRPDLVLMDIRLQGELDGIETAREMRERLHVPVVFLTANSEDEMFHRAMQVGPFGYVLKPFDERELRIVIEMALYKIQAEAKLRESYSELERFNKVAVDRELRMIELKQEINDLLEAAGQAAKYRIVEGTEA